MSDQIKSERKQGVVPRLRFPEFREAGNWGPRKFGQLCKFVRGPFGGALKKEIFVSDGYAVYEQSHAIYGTFDSFRYFITEEKLKELYRFSVRAGDIIMSCSGTMGKIAVIPKNFREGVINQALLKLTVANEHNLDFVKYALELPSNQEKLLSQSAGGAIKNVVGVEQMKEMAICMPEKREQKKIADCLSSLDALIAAQADKLDALKTHKQGLMQRLFPREGETVPRLRFPEFREAGEWEPRKFGQLCKFVRGPFGGALKKEIFVSDGYAVYEQCHAIYGKFDSFRYFITKEKLKELSRFSVRAGDIIMSCSGTMGKFAVIPTNFREGVINQALLKLTVVKEHNLDFLKYALELPSNQEKLLSQSAGGAIKNVVGVEQMKEIAICMPEKREQKKIASCLSDLDTLITAQAAKLEALKTHKQGLMQQLFPSPEAVAA